VEEGPTNRSDGFEYVRKLWSVRVDVNRERTGLRSVGEAELNQTGPSEINWSVGCPAPVRGQPVSNPCPVRVRSVRSEPAIIAATFRRRMVHPSVETWDGRVFIIRKKHVNCSHSAHNIILRHDGQVLFV
jgi:hypothetical protein